MNNTGNLPYFKGNSKMNVNSICISLFLLLFSVPEICPAADADGLRQTSGSGTTQADDSTGNAPDMVRISKTKQGYSFYEGRNKIMFYQQQYKAQHGKYRRCHYIHPLYGLDGEVLTEDFPADHPHHRGIFWGWHQLWLGDKKVGDGWSLQDFSWDVYETKIITEKTLPPTLQVKVLWKSPLHTDTLDLPRPLVRETALIRAYPSENDRRFIDFRISLLALEEGLRLGGSADDKGYGGFTIRIRLPDELEFVGAVGPVQPKRTAVVGGAWMDFSGHFLSAQHVSGIAILVHKSNPGYPQPWILRRKKSAQNAVYPGRHPVALSTTKPLVLRYRLVVHHGDSRQIDLDNLQNQYNVVK
jgi:hypothetical protein